MFCNYVKCANRRFVAVRYAESFSEKRKKRVKDLSKQRLLFGFVVVMSLVSFFSRRETGFAVFKAFDSGLSHYIIYMFRIYF